MRKKFHKTYIKHTKNNETSAAQENEIYGSNFRNVIKYENAVLLI